MSVVPDQAQEQRFELRVPPAFFDELWMSIVDVFDEEREDQRGGMAKIAAALQEQDRVSKKPRILRFDREAAEWFAEWLREESGPYGRWADWGLEGSHLIRTGSRLHAELLDAIVKDSVETRERHAEEDARAHDEGEFDTSAPALVIERAADPLPGGRAQLVQTVFVCGEQVPELSHPVGSPGSAATVGRYVETIKYDVSGRRI